MATLVLDPYAFELDALKERRRVFGMDRLDEVWEGVLHMVPAPDGCPAHGPRTGRQTRADRPPIVAHEVAEVLIVDPPERAIHWLGLDGGEYRPIGRSALIDLGRDALAERIDWP